MTNWAKIPLSSVIKPVQRPEIPTTGKIYRQIGVRLWGQGAYEREAIDGSQTQYASLSRVEEGDVIINKIWARNGSVAVINRGLAGCYGSSEFPTFRPDFSKILPMWFHWITKTSWFWAECDEKSQGTSGKNRIRPEKFLEIKIPLPPLDEQRRIVERIEAVARRVEEAQSIRQQAIDEASTIMEPAEMKIWPDESLEGAPPLADVTIHLARGRQSKQGESSHYLIKTQHVQMGRYVPTTMTLAPEVAANVDSSAMVQNGDILIACSAAGCLGRVASFNEPGKQASTDTHVPVARANPNYVTSDYLYAYLKGAQGQYQLRSRERGDWKRKKVGFRLTELNLKDLQQVPVPVPSLNRQGQIVEYLSNLQSQVETLLQVQTDAKKELDALMPNILDKAFKGEL